MGQSFFYSGAQCADSGAENFRRGLLRIFGGGY